MYRKAVCVLTFVNSMILLAFVCVRQRNGLWQAERMGVWDRQEEVRQVMAPAVQEAPAGTKTLDALVLSAVETKLPDAFASSAAQKKTQDTFASSAAQRKAPDAIVPPAWEQPDRAKEAQGLDGGAEAAAVETLDAEQVEILLRIVEAEAGNEDEDGKLLVANVVLNRVENEAFPDSIREVVYQREKGVSQFSPVANGRIDSVKVSEETKKAVGRALDGEDISDGALYFAARKYADGRKMKWFDDNLLFLFEHGGHEFFR